MRGGGLHKYCLGLCALKEEVSKEVRQSCLKVCYPPDKTGWGWRVRGTFLLFLDTSLFVQGLVVNHFRYRTGLRHSLASLNYYHYSYSYYYYYGFLGFTHPPLFETRFESTYFIVFSFLTYIYN